jgi:hypothetical protein
VVWTQEDTPLRTAISVQDLTTGQPIRDGETIHAVDNIQVTVTTNGVNCAGQVAVTSWAATGTPTGQPDCLPYPAGYVPFTQITSTAVGSVGGAAVTMVVGYTTLSAFQALSSVPLPNAPFPEAFCSPVPLAPNSEWNAYVPTPAMREGDFSSFSGQIINPFTNEPFPGNIIPANLLGTVFAWPTGPNPLDVVSSPFIIGPTTGNSFNLTPFYSSVLASGTNDWKISTSCNGPGRGEFSFGNFEFFVNTTQNRRELSSSANRRQ